MKSKILAIVPSSAHRYLYKQYRVKDPFFDVKIVSKEELFRSFFNKYDASYAAYLIHSEGLTYDFAKEIVSYFPYLDKVELKIGEVTPKLAYIISLKEKCEKSGLVNPVEKPFFPELIYQDREIALHGYRPNDCYLLKLGLNLPMALNIEPKREYDVDYFTDADDEVLYVLNEISSLISSGVSPSNIYINFENKDYTYLLVKYAPIFNLKINHLISKALNTAPICLNFLKKLEECRDLDLALDYLEDGYSDDPNYGTIINLISNNSYKFLSIDEQILIFRKLFSEENIHTDTYLGALNITSGPTFNPDDHIFILGFALDYYPKIKKDNAYLSEKEKEKIGFFVAEELNRTEKDDVLFFLNSPSHIHLSFSEYVFANRYYPVDQGFISQNFIKNHFVSEYFSRDYAYINACKAEDLLSNYLQTSDNLNSLRYYCPEFKDEIYAHYDYSYIGDESKVVEDNKSVSLSYSGASLYLKCPFSYYVKYMLNISDERNTFSTNIGSIAHEVYEKYYKLKDSFNFETVFNDAINNCKGDFTTRDLILLNSNLKYRISFLLSVFKQHDSEMGSALTATYAENKTQNVKLDEDGHISINGKIDKFIVTNNHYAYIVDYKSYQMNFKEDQISNGKSLQLPTYLLLAASDPRLSSYDIAGVFYQRYLPKKPYGDDQYYLLSGKILDEAEALSSFDPNKSVLKYTKKGETDMVSSEDFNRYAETAKKTYLDVGNKILINDFSINPTFFTKTNVACTDCPYKDICFRFSKVSSEEEEENEEESADE
ncbi:MAG: PD-(D/E)XK nuclease family protein [Coprobacillus sp.]|nr:PD-(D/E)XK nuclease family protein [Coprobacillus sp.]